jgi:5-oxoprolinase (ATP-hydrolysing)
MVSLMEQEVCMSGKRYRVGFDIGGTFTDFALHDDEQGTVRIHKALTTPDDPWRGAIEGIRALLDAAGLDFVDLAEIVHGTTLVTNALIEGKGAPTALLATCGFRDVMESGREQRYDIYDLFLQYPPTLVQRKFRREITERMSAAGNVLTDVDLDEVRREATLLRQAGIRSVAVCFLHSYRNPAHERAVGRLLAAEFPEFSVSLSCEVAPEVREYERTCTTAANAFVRPLIDRYVETLEAKLLEQGFTGRLFLMLSSGGLATTDIARRFPVRLLESGPAGGALATSMMSRKLGRPDLISFDMGGTTAKTAMVRDHVVHVAPLMEVARVHRFKKGSGIPVRAPVVEMIEIGAGGGSVAYLDEVNLIKVGPRSAGSKPGPVCYGLGGTSPTVTDADLVLGYLDAKAFLGGRMQLDEAGARAALRTLGEPLGLDAVQAAWGVYEIVCENMAAAARAHVVEKGCDPRAFSMVAFGGAGPVHAARVARIMGVREVLIPPASGAASAIGFLTAPASFETVRSSVFPIDTDLDFAALNQLLAEIEAQSRANLQMADVRPGTETVERIADMRLKGQLHEISVQLPGGLLDVGSLAEIRARFAQVYATLYQQVPPDAAIEALSWRVRVSGPVPQVESRPHVAADGKTALKGTREVFFGTSFVEANVYDRYGLREGDRVTGPAVIEEHESTTIVPPGDHAQVDADGNLRLTIGEAARTSLTFEPGLNLAETVRRIEADPVGLEIMWGRLANIIDEGWEAVVRTAFSLIISDAQDFSIALFDRDGEILVHSPRAQPVFNLSLPRAIKAVLNRFPPNALQPGDVLATNDPWLASGHLYDIAIVTPVFHEGKVVGHVGLIGHVTDIGGTKDHDSVSELYEEGFQIPPMKLYRAGEPNEDLFTLLRENIRDAHMVEADLRALVAASVLAANRLREFLAEYRFDDLSPLAHIFHSRSEAAMRQAIRAVPDGVYQSRISGRIGFDLLELPVKIVVSGDQVAIDMTGVPGQRSKGGYNCTLNYATSHAFFPLKCLLTPGVRGNSGCYRPMSVIVPEGTLLNCRKPAAVSTRQVTGWFLGPNSFAALSDALPDQVRAFSGMPGSGVFYGTDDTDTPYIGHFICGGGQGASARDDGRSGLLFPIGGTATSVELFELRVQLVVTQRQFEPDSGGAGRHRGGLGQRVRFVKLPGDNRPLHYTLRMNGIDIVVPQMRGGRTGLPSSGVVLGGDERAVPAEMSALRLFGNDECLEIRTAGGDGYGDPLTRSLDEIEQDIVDGYISVAHAESEYGCVFAADGALNREASEQKRRRAGVPATNYAAE